jgi:hypothetical protein
MRRRLRRLVCGVTEIGFCPCPDDRRGQRLVYRGRKVQNAIFDVISPVRKTIQLVVHPRNSQLILQITLLAPTFDESPHFCAKASHDFVSDWPRFPPEDVGFKPKPLQISSTVLTTGVLLPAFPLPALDRKLSNGYRRRPRTRHVGHDDPRLLRRRLYGLLSSEAYREPAFGLFVWFTCPRSRKAAMHMKIPPIITQMSFLSC